MAAGDEFAPVAAVLGGVIGNDVIRAVSHSDVPTNNIFLYSLSGRPLVQVLPPPGSGVGAGAAKAAAGQQQQQAKRKHQDEVAAAAAEVEDVILLD